MVGDLLVGALGEIGSAGECGGGRDAAGQEAQQRRVGGAGRGAVALGVDQMPGGVALLGCEVAEQPVGLGGAERQRPQPAAAAGGRGRRAG